MRMCDRGVQMLITTVGAFAAFSLMTIAVGTDYWLYSRGVCRTKSGGDNDTSRKNEEVMTHSGLWRTCCLEGTDRPRPPAGARPKKLGGGQGCPGPPPHVRTPARRRCARRCRAAGGGNFAGGSRARNAGCRGGSPRVGKRCRLRAAAVRTPSGGAVRRGRGWAATGSSLSPGPGAALTGIER